MTTLEQKWQRLEYALHRQDLKRRGITVAQAIERGYEPLTANETYKEIKQGVGATIALTCLQASGKARANRRFRLVDPDKIAVRDKRYTQAAETGILIHVRKPKFPKKEFLKRRVITEGEIKADEIAEHIGVTTISVPGVGCFKKDGKLHPALAKLDWDGYTAELAYDSDLAMKVTVREPLLELADMLVPLGATVQIREIPNLSNQEKTGADDLIRVKGAQGYLHAALHDLDSPVIKAWRESIGKTSSQLPTVLHNLKPIGRDWYDEKPPDAEYVVCPLWQTGESSLFVGQAGVGKTYLVLDMHASIGSGMPFNGFVVPKPRKSLYLMCERAEPSLRRRWHKVTHAKARAMPREARANFERLIHDNCYLKAIAGDSLSLIEFVGMQWRPSPVVDALIRELLAANITVLFFDPLSRLHGGDENDASVAAAITKALERIVQQAKCSVMIVHHTGKSVNGGMHSGRGSSVFNDNTSETIVLTLVTEDDRKKLNIAFEDPSAKNPDIILMRHARCSDGAPAPDTYFLRDMRTGLLRRLEDVVCGSDQKPDEKLATILGSVREWAAKLEDEAFTRSAFVKARNGFRGAKLTKGDAYKTFDNAVSAGEFVPVMVTEGGKRVPKVRNSGELYTLKPPGGSDDTKLPSAPGNYRATGQLPKKRAGNLFLGGTGK